MIKYTPEAPPAPYFSYYAANDALIHGWVSPLGRNCDSRGASAARNIAPGTIFPVIFRTLQVQ